jgi:hypothetical protein
VGVIRFKIVGWLRVSVMDGSLIHFSNGYAVEESSFDQDDATVVSTAALCLETKASPATYRDNADTPVTMPDDDDGTG